MSYESIEFHALVYRRGALVFVLEWTPVRVNVQRERARDRNQKIADWAGDLDDELERKASIPMGLSAVLVEMWASGPTAGCEDYDNGTRVLAVAPLAEPEWRHTWNQLRTSHEEELHRQEQWYKQENERMAPIWDARAAEMNAQLAAQAGPNKDRPQIEGEN